MPTYHRPKVAYIDPGGTDVTGLVLVCAGIAAAAAVALFVLAHVVLLAVCAAVFVAVIGGVAVMFRQAASPRRWREYRYPRPTVRLTEAEAARVISAPRPLAIEAPRQFFEDRSPDRSRTLHDR